MPRKYASILTLVLPALALAGCGASKRETELAQQLEQAQAEAKAATEAKAEAERAAAVARAQNDGGMSDFYDSGDEGDAMDPSPDDDGEDHTVNRGPQPSTDISAADPVGAPEISGDTGPMVPPGA